MRRSLLCVLSALVVYLGVGCSSSGDGPPPDDIVDSSVDLIVPELPTAIGSDEAPITPLTELETARIELDSPDWMSYEDDSLWVRLDNGEIVRIDPTAAEVTAEVRATGNGQFSACQGFGSSPGAIWSCSPWGPLQRVDGTTGRTVANLPIEMSSRQGHLVVADSRLWVLTPDGTSLVPVDLATNKVGDPIQLGAACTDLAAADMTVWVVCPWDDQVLAVDLGSGEVTGGIQLDEPRQAAVANDLWVSFADGVGQIDLDDLSVTALYDTGGGDSSALAAGEGAVWVRTDGGPFLIGIDPAAREIFAVVTARDLPSGGNSMAIDGEIWATAYDDATVVRLDPPPR
jgi:hypothetical protein